TAQMERFFGAGTGGLGALFEQVAVFSASRLNQVTIFGLGIMPYISASIIFQLLASVWPPLERLQKEGESGRKKINEYTRYATVVICLFQAWMWVTTLVRPQNEGGYGMGIPHYVNGWYVVCTIMTMTAGTVFLMWI